MRPREVTRLLFDWSCGDRDALARLMPLVCDELRQLARRYMKHEVSGHTLQPTALVNEVYLRLHGCQTVTWTHREHFFGFAAQTMRRVLVDHARRHQRVKRGEGLQPFPLDETTDRIAEHTTDLEALDEALHELAALDPRQSRIVELRYFVGLTIEETAEVLGISPATVKREWKVARLWLHRALRGDPGS